MKKFIIPLLAAVMVVPLMGGCLPGAAPPAAAPPEEAPPAVAPPEEAPPGPEEPYVDRWKLPILGIYTGPWAVLGRDYGWAIDKVVDEINAAGGIRGRPVYTVSYDEKYDPDMAVAMFPKAAEDALVIYGPMTCDTGIAVIEIAHRMEIMYFDWLCTWEWSKEGAPWCYNYAANLVDDEGAIFGEYCKLHPEYKSAVIMYLPESWMYTDQAYNIGDNGLEQGMEWVEYLDVPFATVDYSSIAEEAIATGADVFNICSIPAPTPPIVKELRLRGIEPDRIIAQNYGFSSDYFDAAGAEILDGTWLGEMTNGFYPGEKWESYLAMYRDETGTRWPQVNGWRYALDFPTMMKDCYEELEVTGNPAKQAEERAAVRDWFYSLKGYEGVCTVYNSYPEYGGNQNTNGSLYQFDGKEPVLIQTNIQAEVPDWVK